MEQEPNAENELELLKEAIAQSPEEIEREFENTTNPWLACVNTRLTVFMGHIGLARMENLITEDEERTFLERAKSLANRVSELQKTYSEKEDEVPSEIKEEILSQLNILE